MFADTGYLIAILNPRGELHQKASTISREYGYDLIVTNEMVLVEFLNNFSVYGPGKRQPKLSPQFETASKLVLFFKQANFSTRP